ncbi:MAG: MFS transporter [Gaiellaceae bacterium]
MDRRRPLQHLPDDARPGGDPPGLRERDHPAVQGRGRLTEPDGREAERLGAKPPVPGGVKGVLSRAVVDIGPLKRHRDFRLLFGARNISLFGSGITYVAIPYQVYQLSGSTLLVGLLGIVELVPLLFTALLGGALADWRDRRRMVLLSELGLALATGVLLVNSLLPNPQLWVLFVVASVMAGLDGIQRPSLDALVPRLVSREELPAASALESFGFNLAEIGGPALAGILIATVGLPATYGLDIATFAVSLGALSLMKAATPPAGAEPPSLRRIVEGFRFARSRPELMGTYSVDIVAMFFGMPLALFPAFAEEFGGPEVLGLLYAAPAHVHRHGVAVVLAASVWGLGVLVFGLAPGLPLALAGLAVAGAGDMVSGIFRTTIWNQTIPDELRGRLAGIEQISYSSGPLLGQVRAGVVGSLAGIRFAAVSGGALCIVGVALTALALPAFWRYDASRST